MSEEIALAAGREITTPRPAAEIEVGVPDYLPFAQPYENLWEQRRADEVSISQLEAMRKTDGQARALYRLMTLPLLASLRNCEFVPSEDEEGGDAEAQFIKDMFMLSATSGGMKTPFTKVMAQMLSGIFTGFSVFEIVYGSPQKGKLKGKWTIDKLAYRPSATITFLTDLKGNFKGVRQQAVYNGVVVDTKIDPENVVYYTAQEDERPYYGHSYFHAAFYHWDKKVKLYYLMHVAAQRNATGTRVGTVPPEASKTDRSKFNAALAQLGFAQYITVPPGFEVDVLKEGGSFPFIDYINHHNNQMSKSVLAGFFDDSSGTGGDAPIVDFGQQSDGLFMMMLEFIMREVAAVINDQIIPRFIDWNFASGKYPKFKWGPLTDVQKEAIKDVFGKLMTIGQASNTTPDFMLMLEEEMAKELNFKIDYAEIRAEREAAEEAAKDAPLPPAPESDQGTSGDVLGAGDTTQTNYVPAQFLPNGFSLSAESDDNGEVRLASVRRVATAEGAKRYGKPIGTIITKEDIDASKKNADIGSRGDYRPAEGTTNTGRPAKGSEDNPKSGEAPKGSEKDPKVKKAPDAQPAPMLVFTHPQVPGAKLVIYDDESVAIQYPDGTMSRRRKFGLDKFKAKGWKQQS